MRTNLQIFDEIKRTGFITESDLNLLKSRSNKAQKDQFDYDILDHQDIKVTPSQGVKGLKWLKSFIDKNNSPYDYREISIIQESTENDFTFRGFYDAGNGWFKNYLPIYELNGMEYIPMRTPYIIG